MPTITLDCPICGYPLDIQTTVIWDSDGDADSPYGTRTFLSLDDYSIEWDSHDDIHPATMRTYCAYAWYIVSEITPPFGYALHPLAGPSRPHWGYPALAAFEQTISDTAIDAAYNGHDEPSEPNYAELAYDEGHRE